MSARRVSLALDTGLVAGGVTDVSAGPWSCAGAATDLTFGGDTGAGTGVTGAAVETLGEAVADAMVLMGTAASGDGGAAGAVEGALGNAGAATAGAASATAVAASTGCGGAGKFSRNITGGASP